jgi:hypothetical protein
MALEPGWACAMMRVTPIDGLATFYTALLPAFSCQDVGAVADEVGPATAMGLRRVRLGT